MFVDCAYMYPFCLKKLFLSNMCIFTFQLEVFIQEVKVNSFGSKFSFHVRCVVFLKDYRYCRISLVNSQELL